MRLILMFLPWTVLTAVDRVTRPIISSLDEWGWASTITKRVTHGADGEPRLFHSPRPFFQAQLHTLQTRYVLPVQNPYFSSPIIHVLRVTDNHVLSFDDQLVLDARDDYELSDNARRLVWLLWFPTGNLWDTSCCR